MIRGIDEVKLAAAQTRVREADERFRDAGRPADSSCACLKWPCDCVCHRPARQRVKS